MYRLALLLLVSRGEKSARSMACCDRGKSVRPKLDFLVPSKVGKPGPHDETGARLPAARGIAELGVPYSVVVRVHCTYTAHDILVMIHRKLNQAQLVIHIRSRDGS